MSEIKVCPSCDSPKIRQRIGHAKDDSIRLDNHQYRCRNCQHSFDTPHTRERKYDAGPSADAILNRILEGQQ